MIIARANKRRTVVRPAVLVSEARARALDDGKLYDLDRLPDGLRVYAPWEQVDELARSGAGELVSWGDEPIRWRHRRHGDSHRRKSDVIIVKQAVDARRGFDAGVAAWAEWLDSYDVNPGWSLGGTSFALMRRLLPQAELVTTNGTLPPPRWTLGGRQQCWVPEGTVIRGALQLDMQAAYTHVIGGMRYGGAWRALENGGAHFDRLARADYSLLARARVRLPRDGVVAGPLPQRPRRRPDPRIGSLATAVSYPTEGALTGLWTYDELTQAEAAGCGVRVLEAYVHAGGDYVFADWHDAIMDGRTMPGFGGALAKATGNALWGQFVIDDRKRLNVQRWNGEHKSLQVQGSRGHQKRAWDVGEHVCGTIRARLFGALRVFDDTVICCHTDGFWVRDTGSSWGSNWMRANSDWRLKTDVDELEVIDQSKYRYREHGKRKKKIVCSGVPSNRAEQVFQEVWAKVA